MVGYQVEVEREGGRDISKGKGQHTHTEGVRDG
jgi:hypothetical protein